MIVKCKHCGELSGNQHLIGCCLNGRVDGGVRQGAHILPAAGDADGPTPSRYRWRWKGAGFDFYRLCEILGVRHHAQAHALKKVIRAGQSVKSIEQDIDEAIDALLRWKEMVGEDAADGEILKS